MLRDGGKVKFLMIFKINNLREVFQDANSRKVSNGSRSHPFTLENFPFFIGESPL